MAKPSPAPAPPPSKDVFAGFHDFFASPTWFVIRNVAVFVVALLWLATVFWVLKDARRRIADPVLVAVATVLGAVPIVGLLIYLLVRPPEYVADVRERRLEIEALQSQLAAKELECPTCSAPVGADFLLCPLCATRLKEACAGCRTPLEPIWQACPHCGTRRGAEPDPAPKPARRRARRPERAVLDAYLLDVARDGLPDELPEGTPAPETV